jgi:type I restriction enzyme S subunit
MHGFAREMHACIYLDGADIPWQLQLRNLLRLSKCLSPVLAAHGIPKMTPEWRKTTLGEEADFFSGGTPSKDRSDYWAGTVPWVSAKDMKRFRIEDTEDHVSEDGVANGTRLVPEGTVLLLTRGMTLLNDLPICVISRPMTFNQDVKAVRPRSNIHNSYLPYLLQGNKSRLLSRIDLASHGTGRLNSDELKSLEIVLPPLSEQRAIAHILGTLDDKIDLNRRMNETLEAMARALFKSWFVDFDPVRTKAEGRDPGLPQEIASLFPDRFVESELGEIPEGWEVGSVYEFADVIYGAPFSSAQFNTERRGEPLVRIRDLTNEDPSVWTPEFHPKGYKVRPGDIVVGMDGEFRAYLWGGAEAWLNQRVCVFVPKDQVSAAFVRESIVAPLAHIEATETATTVIHLGKGDIDRFTMIIPNRRVLSAFNETCQPWYERIVSCKQESRALIAHRDTLLPKLVSGELQVTDPELFLSKVIA